MYGFNPCIPIDLVPILINERTSMGRVKKAEMMKKLPGYVRSHIEEKIINYAKHVNKGKKMVRFESGDLVLIHLTKAYSEAIKIPN
jgi:translation initiation factor IF-1